MTLVGLSIAGPKSRDAAAEADRRRRVERGLPVHGPPRDGHRHGAGAGQPRHLYRRPRLRDLGGAGVPAALYQEIKEAGADSASSISACARCSSMRLEKNFPTWYRELRPIYGVFEAGLDRFIDLTKNDFIGREAAMKEKRRAASCAASPWSSTRRRRRDGRRADLARRQGGGLGHLGRLRALRRQVAGAGLRAERAGGRTFRARARSRSRSSATAARPRSSRTRRLFDPSVYRVHRSRLAGVSNRLGGRGHRQRCFRDRFRRACHSLGCNGERREEKLIHELAMLGHQ
jgi:hypothetical protein